MLDELMDQWANWKTVLDNAKEQEMGLRKQICSTLFEGSESKGIIKFDANGIFYKANNTTTMKIDQEALNGMWEDLSETEKECISFVAKVKWKDLPENSILWDIITEKPTTPTITPVKKCGITK